MKKQVTYSFVAKSPSFESLLKDLLIKEQDTFFEELFQEDKEHEEENDAA
ncbi:hypothetical protein F4694_005683 [Bacillus niacini]|uniref:Uncharacterized protein n=1 Tax=Neobacillus niacini TaxID=86668 RepID=A0A852TMX1_9BACI|nr:hypothetical protein [Neobacillus niacini]NYE08827.1 hypothetical protein [Neobacillus niacini]